MSFFLNSDDSFMVYRRFGTVFSRLLLAKQDEMSRMEESLKNMDKTDKTNGNERFLMSHDKDNKRKTFPAGFSESRTQLLCKMERHAIEYG